MTIGIHIPNSRSGNAIHGVAIPARRDTALQNPYPVARTLVGYISTVYNAVTAKATDEPPRAVIDTSRTKTVGNSNNIAAYMANNDIAHNENDAAIVTRRPKYELTIPETAKKTISTSDVKMVSKHGDKPRVRKKRGEKRITP